MSKTFEETLASIDSTLLLILAALQAGSPAATGTSTSAATVMGAEVAKTEATADAGKTETPAVRGKTAYFRLPEGAGVIAFGANTSNEPPAGSTKITKAEYDKAVADKAVADKAAADEAEAKKAQTAGTPDTPNPDTSADSSKSSAGAPAQPASFADVQTALTKLGQTPETGRQLLLDLFKKWGVSRFPELAQKNPPIPNDVLLADIANAGKPPVADDPFGDLGL